jgi:anaerobic selenocysteine-containing dehydrogenase
MWFNPGYLMQTHLATRSPVPAGGRSYDGPRSRPELRTRYGERPSAALVSEIEAGNIGALFVVGGNPLLSLPDSKRTLAALKKLDVLAVADIVDNEMVQLATHVLACAGQLERAEIPYGTDIFQKDLLSQFTPAVVPPVAQRKPLWWSIGHLARRIGTDVFPGIDLDTVTEESLLDPLIDASVDPVALRASPTAVVASGPIYGWVAQNVLPQGRWRLAPEPLLNQLEQALQRSPQQLVVTSRRTLGTMNSQFRTVAPPGGALDTPQILIHPLDAQAAGVVDGGSVRVDNTHG